MNTVHEIVRLDLTSFEFYAVTAGYCASVRPDAVFPSAQQLAGIKPGDFVKLGVECFHSDARRADLETDWRPVGHEALWFRVVDECEPDRGFSSADWRELLVELAEEAKYMPLPRGGPPLRMRVEQRCVLAIADGSGEALA